MKKIFSSFALALVAICASAEGSYSYTFENIYCAAEVYHQDSLIVYNETDGTLAEYKLPGTTTEYTSFCGMVITPDGHQWIGGIQDNKATLWRDGEVYRQYARDSYYNLVRLYSIITLPGNEVAMCGYKYRSGSADKFPIYFRSDYPFPQQLSNKGEAVAMTCTPSGEIITVVKAQGYHGTNLRYAAYIYRNSTLTDSLDNDILDGSYDFDPSDVAYIDNSTVLVCGTTGQQGDLGGYADYCAIGANPGSGGYIGQHHDGTEDDDTDDCSFQAMAYDGTISPYMAGYEGRNLCVWKGSSKWVIASSIGTYSMVGVYDLQLTDNYLYILGYVDATKKLWRMRRNGTYQQTAYTFNSNCTPRNITLDSGTYHDLAINYVNVRETTKNDILGDGTLSFDETTNTLTVNGTSKVANVRTMYSNLNIVLPNVEDTLTVEGYKYSNAINVTKDLTISGKGYLLARARIADIAARNISISKANLYLLASTATTKGMDVQNGKLTLDSATLFVRSCPGTISNIGTLEMTDCYIENNVRFDATQKTFINNLDNSVAYMLDIQPGKKYDVEVCGRAVTSNRANDIFPLSPSNRISYDAETKTLTMQHVDTTSSKINIWAEDDLNSLHLQGYNKLTCSSENNNMYILNNTFEFTGDSLELVCTEGGNNFVCEGGSDEADAIHVTISCKSLVCNGRIQNFTANGKLTISGHLEALNLWDWQEVELVNASIIEPANGFYDTAKSTVVDANGNEASHVVIDKVDTALESTREHTTTIKAIENGQVVILRNGVRYNALGIRF